MHKTSILLLLFFAYSNENGVPQSNCKKRDVIDSVLTRISRTLGGCLLYSTKDLLAFGIKSCMNQYVGNHHFFTCGPIDLCSDHIIDYGCEAIWAGYCEGIHKIPHRLVAYAVADRCYMHLHALFERHDIGLHSLFAHKPLCHIMIILEPLLARRLIVYILGQGIDALLCDEEDQDIMSDIDLVLDYE